MYRYPKKIQTIPELAKKWMDAGMEVDSEDDMKSAFETIGYYRLKGYCFHLLDKTTKQYQEGTTFANVLKLYEFDCQLSHLIFKFSTQIEVSLRTRLVESLLLYGNALVLNDPSKFTDKVRYWKNQSSIASEIARSNDSLIKHHYENHDGAIPLWAAVEVMSFGTLSKVVKTLETGKDSAFSVLIQHYRFKNVSGKEVNPSKKMFTSWVQAVSIMRNICAHNSRIYNRTINIAPELINDDKISPLPRYSGLYQVLMAMKYLRPTDKAWEAFTVELMQLLKNYADVVELPRLNFPSDWRDHLTVGSVAE